MGALDKMFNCTINLSNGAVKFDKNVTLYNVDKNVFVINAFLTSDGKTPIDVSELNNYVVKISVVKPAKAYVELEGIVEDDHIKFDLGNKFNSSIGGYTGEFFITNNGEEINTSPFKYSVTGSILTGLNAEIESNPDLPILKELIQEVRGLSGLDPVATNTLLSPYQKKSDNTLQTNSKEIPSAINELNENKANKTEVLLSSKLNDNGTGVDELWSANKLNNKFDTVAKDLIIENDKLYLKQLDGTKIGSGVNLPINNSSSGKVWTLVKSIITTEEVSLIEISTDSNGNTFLLSDFVIYIKSLSSTSFPSKGSIRLTYKNNFNSCNITYVGLSNIFNSPTHCIIEQYKDNNIQSIPKLFKKTISCDTNIYEKSLCSISNINNVKIESITSGITFPIGTILEVWK